MPQEKKRMKNPGNPNPGGARSTAASRSQAQAEPMEERIRQRAYEIYMARGGAAGDAMADWFQAERELRAGMQE